jgi:hypothetical protein
MRTPSPKFAVALIAAAFLAGCGGGGGASLSRAEYIKQADRVCFKDRRVRLGEAAAYSKSHEKKLSQLTSLEASGAMVDAVLIPGMRKQIKEFEAIEVPAGDSGKIHAYTAAVHRGLAETEEEPGSYKASLGNTFNEANKLGHEYGFRDCGWLP